MELQVKSAGGATSGQITVSDETFARPFNEALVHQVVIACLANARAGTRAQKTRAEVSGGGIKPGTTGELTFVAFFKDDNIKAPVSSVGTPGTFSAA